jgi:hypothetical protein
MRISNSFSEGEIQVLDFILTTLLRGGSPQMATRSKDFASLCRKVVSMKTRANQKDRGDTRPERDRSSVGEVEAPESGDEAIDTSLEDVG